MKNTSTTSKIDFYEFSNFFEKQKKATALTKIYDYLLYGGALGSGKSRWIRWMPIYWLIRWFNLGLVNVRTGIFCEDYPSLHDRHLSYIKNEFPRWLGSYNDQRHEFTLEKEYGGGTIASRNLDDPDKYLSVEFALIGVDEINRNSRQDFDALRRRLRWPGIEHPKFLGACNAVGEPWVRDLWVDRLFPKELEAIRDQFCFVEATATDNPYLPQSYYDSLNTQDPIWVDAAMKGNWHAFDSVVDESGYQRLLPDQQYKMVLTDYKEHAGDMVLGVDPAAGGDNSAIVLKSANLQEILFNQKLPDTMDLCDIVYRCFKENGVKKVIVDKTGIGQGVVDKLKRMGVPVVGVSFGEKPSDNTYSNLKAELFWRERKWLLSGGRLVRSDLWEFPEVKYKTKDGKISIQPKEELLRTGIKSPNLADAAVLTMFEKETTIASNTQLQYLKARGFKDNSLEIWRGN